MRGRFFYISVIWICMFLSLTGCQDKSKEKKIKLSESAKLVISEYKVTRDDIYDMSVSKGYVGGIQHSVSFSNPGEWEEWKVKLGDKVKKGDILCTQKSEELRKEAEIRRIAWHATQKREKLVNQELAKVLEESKKAMDEADKDTLEYATLEWKKCKLSAEFQKQQQEREIAEAKRLYEEQQQKVEDTILKAPCDGIVNYCKDINEELSPGETQAVVTEIDTLVVNLEIMEYSSFKSEKYTELTGLVGDKIIPLTLGRYERDEVRYAVSNNQKLMAFLTAEKGTKLTLGDTVMVKGKNNVANDVLYIPPECLHTTDTEMYVYKMVSGKPVKTDVKVGVRTKNALEITAGLEEGDSIQCPSDVSISPDLEKYEVKDEDYVATIDSRETVLMHPITQKLFLPYTDARLTKINVEKSDHVKKGDTILEYDLLGSKAKVMEIENQLEEAIAQGGEDNNPEVEKIRSELDKAKDLIGHKTFQAPFDGRIVTLTSVDNLNHLLNPENALVELEDDSYGVIRVIDENCLYRLGQKCNVITFDGQHTLSAHVVRAAIDYYDTHVKIYSEGANYQSMVMLDEPLPKGVALSDARVELDCVDVAHACMIPAKALYDYDGRYYVWSFENEQFVRRYVILGDVYKTKVWIAEGIEPGMKLGVGADHVANLEEQSDDAEIKEE